MRVKKEDIVELMMIRLEKALKKSRIVKPPKLKMPNQDEEIFGVILSDTQIGLKTRTYNMRIFEKRLQKYVNNIRIILRKERRSIPIKRCVVFMLGDILHNDVIGRFLELEEFEAVVIKQWLNVAVPNFEMMFKQLLKDFETIEVCCVMGN